jgi:hypothetical protein
MPIAGGKGGAGRFGLRRAGTVVLPENPIRDDGFVGVVLEKRLMVAFLTQLLLGIRSQDAPDFRRPQKLGPIASGWILGGLHHQYVRV